MTLYSNLSMEKLKEATGIENDLSIHWDQISSEEFDRILAEFQEKYQIDIPDQKPMLYRISFQPDILLKEPTIIDHYAENLKKVDPSVSFRSQNQSESYIWAGRLASVLSWLAGISVLTLILQTWVFIRDIRLNYPGYCRFFFLFLYYGFMELLTSLIFGLFLIFLNHGTLKIADPGILTFIPAASLFLISLLFIFFYPYTPRSSDHE